MRQAYLVADAVNDHLPNWLNHVTLDQLDALTNDQISCLLLDASDWDLAYETLKKIRQSNLPVTYLKPVVLLLDNVELTDEQYAAFDLVVNKLKLTEQYVNELSSKFEFINQWIDTLDAAQVEIDRSLAFKLLRFIASRELTLGAHTTLSSKSGFVYPPLEPFLGVSDGGVLHTVEYLEQQRLLNGEFQTKARFCSHCESAFLNFKEVCTHCGHEDLAIDELVHHFKCGYVAELQDYKQGNQLTCPKCDNKLKHIGVDFDKPSIIYRCRSCTHSFQEPGIMTSCFNCGRSTEPENQQIKIIKTYSMTSIGHHAAKYGLSSLFTSILSDEIQLMDYQSFLQFVQIEGGRIERYKVSNSTLLLLYLKGLEDIYIHLGSRAGDMFKELSNVIHSVLRSSDIISAKDDAMFAVVLTETDMENAELVINRLKEGIHELMTENMDEYFELISEIHAIESPSVQVSELLESILARNLD